MSAKQYGIVGVYREPEPLVAATQELRRLGLGDLDAFTPFPVPELDAILGITAHKLPWITLAGGIAGALLAYGLALYSVEIDYPVNVGGRALNAWPAYTVLAFEGGILGAALAAFLGMLIVNRLPLYYHPIFNARGFSFAKGDKFYLLVKPNSSPLQVAAIREALAATGAIAIEDVPE